MRLIVSLAVMLTALGVLIVWLVIRRSEGGATQAGADVTEEGALAPPVVGSPPASVQRRASDRGLAHRAASEGPVATAESTRDEQVARLIDSGAAPPELFPAMKAMHEQLKALAADPALGAKVSDWRCYRAGCFSNVTHKDLVSVEMLGRRFLDSRPFQSWAGARFRSGPIALPDGRLEITWVFQKPEEPTAMAQ